MGGVNKRVGVSITQAALKSRVCWQPVIHAKGKSLIIGTYLTHKRAVIGSQLFKHWMSLGFDPLTIPRCPR